MHPYASCSGKLKSETVIIARINISFFILHLYLSAFTLGPGQVGDSKGLKLSPCVLAKIMQGDITTWDHADIKAENPSLNVPAGTQIKADGSWMDVASTNGPSLLALPFASHPPDSARSC